MSCDLLVKQSPMYTLNWKKKEFRVEALNLKWILFYYIFILNSDQVCFPDISFMHHTVQ